jgi:hypothetical protein
VRGLRKGRGASSSLANFTKNCITPSSSQIIVAYPKESPSITRKFSVIVCFVIRSDFGCLSCICI